MLINLRNALMAGKRLPYDAEVEYLGCTGGLNVGQYIDTGVAPTDDARFELTVEQDTTVSLANVGLVCAWKTVGDATTAGTYIVSRIHTSTGRGTYIQWGKSSTVGVNIPYPTGRVTFGISKSGMTYNGDAAYSIQATAVSQLGNAYILGSPASGMRRLYGKFYGYKHYEGNILVRDFIPVRKGTVGYLYDRVSGKLFGNAGTGDFVLGPDVVPVEYIESSSNHTQVIDTGFYANQNTKALITFEKLGADGWLFGARNGSSSATDKFGIFAYQSPNGKISAQVGNIYIEPIISGGLTNRKKTVELSLADGVIVDGETIATFYESQKSQTFTSTYPMALFNMRVSGSGFNSGIYCRVYAYQIFGNGLIARNFLPVRVGSGTTWEGAMMDVLTRRIYRNAGTGAFSYGNDLKYPIPAE